MRKIITTAVVLIVALAMWGSSQIRAASQFVKPPAPALSGVAVAFAKVDILNGNVLTFGGKGTAQSFIDSTDSNAAANVVFNGKYPKGLSGDQLVVIASCQNSPNFGVAGADVISVSSTQLIINVNVWKSDTLERFGDTVFFAVYVGR